MQTLEIIIINNTYDYNKQNKYKNRSDSITDRVTKSGFCFSTATLLNSTCLGLYTLLRETLS